MVAASSCVVVASSGCWWLFFLECAIEKRATKADLTAAPPKPIPGIDRQHRPGVFPELKASLLEKDLTASGRREGTKWRKKGRVFQQVEHLQMNADQREVC